MYGLSRRNVDSRCRFFVGEKAWGIGGGYGKIRMKDRRGDLI